MQVEPPRSGSSFATRPLEHGADLPSFQCIPGHEHLEKPGRYLHPSAEKRQEAVS